MCLASCSSLPPPQHQPIAISTTVGPLAVTDGLVDLANDLLGDAPASFRCRIFTMLGMDDTPDARIPYCSVAFFMGRKEEHAAAVRMIVNASTLVGMPHAV